MDAREWKAVSGFDIAERCGRGYRADERTLRAEEPWLAWLGHGSFALKWRGTTLVIDPVFRKRIGIFSRRVPVPNVSCIGKVDAALVSHAHMDHLDASSLARLQPRRILLPKRSEGFLSGSLRRRCEALECWQEVAVGALSVTATPARHGGWRYPWQKGYFACGFLVSDGRRSVYFTGDTAYGTHFEEIARRWKIDTAVLPIGAYDPQWFLGKRHLNPEEACRAALDLRAASVAPGHFGSYRLSLEPLNEPMRRFASEARRFGIDWRLPHLLDE